MPAETHVLQESISKVLSLTEVNIVSENLQACHCMKNSDRVILKFEYLKQKQSLMRKCKNLGTKS